MQDTQVRLNQELHFQQGELENLKQELAKNLSWEERQFLEDAVTQAATKIKKLKDMPAVEEAKDDEARVPAA